MMNKGIDSSPHLRDTLQKTTAESNISCFFGGFSTRQGVISESTGPMGSLVKTNQVHEATKLHDFASEAPSGTNVAVALSRILTFFLRSLFFDVEGLPTQIP